MRACAVDDPCPQNQEARLLAIEKHLATGYATINEERAIDGNPPVAWGDEPILPSNMAPLSKTLEVMDRPTPQPLM